MRNNSKRFHDFREYLETVRLVDTHDHTWVCGPRYTDPMQVVLGGYMYQDIAGCSPEGTVERLRDASIPLEERWPALERAWSRCSATGFGRETLLLLREFYGESEVTLAGLRRMGERMTDLSDEAAFERLLERAGIDVRLLSILGTEFRRSIPQILDGTIRLSPRARLTIRLPIYHDITRHDDVAVNMAPLGRTVTSLDEYLHGCRDIFLAYKRAGAVAFKDICAYKRSLAFGNPCRADAERAFNWIMEDPRRQLEAPDGAKALDDFLFHEFLRMARDLDLVVQLHTGKCGGSRNDCQPTNAVGLIPVLNLHRDVRFDLLHANWPYAQEILYIAKQYPNVAIDFVWAQSLDPLYCQDLMRSFIVCVPNVRVHAYGSDFPGFADRAWAAASVARDNVAIALTDLVDQQWLDIDEAKAMARRWLHDNASEFFKLDARPGAAEAIAAASVASG
jgi:uncharacterized protein